ncbi:hypothetical protein T12_1440 [Trichinella patagoniensis]|uniref:Uncharacterized protein n=1 Tax=Trichinella patagoniensis TaxID=990121 RepID=A0A0V0ZWZ5_9BILA|nr:hypothetical protein T12_1440 [Trichinella patagoniensis]
MEIAEPQLNDQPNDLAVRVQYSSTCSNHVSTFDDLANTSGGQPIPDHRLLLCSPIEALVCITNDYEPSQIVKWFFFTNSAKVPVAIEIP